MATRLNGQLSFRSISDEARVPRSLLGWRNVIGQLAEEIAAERIGAKRLHTGMSREYCPDLRDGRADYEVKAVGKSRQVIIYHARLMKDRWYASENRLCYVFVIHGVRISAEKVKGMTMADARREMETARVFVVPFCYVDAICAEYRCRILNKKYKPANGWCQRGYEQGGYSVPVSRFLSAFQHGEIR